MPIPALTADGYLPVGEFDCDLTEVQQTFGINDHRVGLLDKLGAFLEWLRDHHGLELPFYIDGSFTTSKHHPNDIDFVIDLTNAPQDQIGRAFGLWAVERAAIKENFKVDYWPYVPGAPKDLRAFFQYVRVEELHERQLPMETRKGILRIEP